jgi:hypothetical protein
MTEIYKTYKGYTVRTKDTIGRWLYISNTRNGRYTFTCDYTYAKTFSEDTAHKHAEALEGR